ncbi:MAG: FliA/WhiG family RNA polymerase sigma factor [Planctomycetota bacterium]|jgi:RNA polymerase sigma factor for flagellar operon FliA|nr:FliA/WhiG family RNA polymerase sigma factor [Planctomycetota bacterium]
MNEYTESYKLPPPLSEEEETELWQRYIKTRDDETRSVLIENYLPLVFHMAEQAAKHLPTHLEVQDLISYGNFGLLDAIRKFNPDEGVKFSTYCNRRIYGAIVDELRRQDWPSRQVRKKVSDVRKAREELELELGRPPFEYELAEYLNLSGKDYDSLMQEVHVKSMVSLDRKWDDSDDNEIGPIETIPDTNAPDPLEKLIRAEIKEVALRGLSEDEKKVLVLYYYENLNLKEIGAILDLSESRVCQIHQHTLNFLKEKFTQRHISTHSI